MHILDEHKRSIKSDAFTDGKIVMCSCGARWSITKQQFADGDDGYDAHVKKITGKYPAEHD